MNTLCKPGNDLDHVLATVEDEKQTPVAQKIDDAVCRIGMVHDQPERRSDGTCDKRRVFQRAQIEKAHLTIERCPHVMGQRDGDGCLADPAGTSERDEALAQQSARQFLQYVLPSDHPLQTMRERNRRRSLRDARCVRCRCRHVALHGSDKAIAAARHVRDIARTLLAVAERLAKFGDVNPEADLLDNKARPRVGEKLALWDHLTRAVDQKPQDIQRPAPQLDRDTIPLEQPRLVMKRKRPEGDSA